VSPQHRRDFLLDSGAVTALAQNPRLVEAYQTLFESKYDGSILIPMVVVPEFSSGDPRKEAPVDRFINALIKTQGSIYLPLTSLALAKRAGALRTEAKQSKGKKISPIDALIVAIAEDLSLRSAVTILTGDPKDIQTLVNITRRPNIAVVKIS
jgi:hypothetical protein